MCYNLKTTFPILKSSEAGQISKRKKKRGNMCFLLLATQMHLLVNFCTKKCFLIYD